MNPHKAVTILFGINTIVTTLAAVTTFSTMNALGMGFPSPEKAFLLISVWNVVAAMLRLVPLGFSSLSNIRTAVSRVEKFLGQEEINRYVQDVPMGSVYSIYVDIACLEWNANQPCLKYINMKVETGQTVVITGAVGAGKSSVLGALTNQMTLASGSVAIDDSKSYAPQEPWLKAGSVKENILFGSGPGLNRSIVYNYTEKIKLLTAV